MIRTLTTLSAALATLVCTAQPLVNWELRRSSAEDTENWIPAKVPSTVAVAYRDAGLLEDIRYDDNLTRIDDKWYNSDFEYRTSFKKPGSIKEGERIILNFDGISWKADVSLNGKSVGRIEGSFIRSHFDITDLLQDDNTLQVLIHCQDHPGEVKIPTLDNSVLNGGILGADNPCFHASIGWDWLPTVPGRNIGIWNDVYLTRAERGIIIEDAFFDTVLDKKYYPGAGAARPEYATIIPSITLNNFSGKAASEIIEIRFGDKIVSQTVSIPEGRSDISLNNFRIDRPRLWWPVGYGEPDLYEVTVKVGGMEKKQKCGIRQMFYTLENNALQMYINGLRFIPKGGNWGFSDINLEATAREYDIALRMHRLMNFNMVRNWVGQVGDEEFYQACDKYGVMIWQDFWLANPCDGPDPYDEAMFVRNAEDMVHKVRSHASLALFCARNEGIPTRTLELHLNRLVADLCPHSLFIPNSSEFCVSGQGPYFNHPASSYFRNISMAVDIPVGDNKFHSERGAPCIPSYESLCRLFRPEHRWPQNDVWAMHNFTLGGAQKCSELNNMISKGFGAEPTSLKEFSDRAQYINYNTYRAMFESRSNHRNGLLLWMSHPAWPCLVFQTYDYWFDVNAGTYASKKGCAPLRIQYNPVLECVEVVNECQDWCKGLQATVRCLDINGKVLSSGSYTFDTDIDSTYKVCDFKAPGGVDLYYLKLELFNTYNELISDNLYWEGAEQGVWDKIPTAPDNVLKTVYVITDDNVTATVTNTGKVVLPMVRLDLMSRGSGKNQERQVLPSFYGDNYFGLLPGESKTVNIGFLPDEHKGEKIYVTARYLR